MGSKADADFCFGFGGDGSVVAIGISEAFVVMLDNESDATEGERDGSHFGVTDEFIRSVRGTFGGDKGVAISGCGLM